MSDPSARTFSSDFKRFFVRGLVVLLPSVLTLWIVVAAYRFVDDAFAEPINQSMRVGIAKAAPYWEPLRDWFDPDDEELAAAIVAAGPKAPPADVLRARIRADNIHAWWTSRWYMNVIGLIVAVVAVYIAGRLLGGFLGRSVYRRIERVITTLPVFKQVYPYVKQIVDFLFSDEKNLQFNRVVLVQYPRQGIWSVAFQTGGAMKAMEERAGDSVTLFIPSSPTPFTGYTICVPRRDVVELPITVEEAIRFVVSGGVLMPPHQQGPLLEPTHELSQPADEAIQRSTQSPQIGAAAAPPAPAMK